jgi:hypothetical protein
MKYREHFDSLGNPYYRRVDWDGLYIIIGCLAILLILGLVL